MRKTLLKIQEILDDIRSDAKLLNLSPLTNKVEKVLQWAETAHAEYVADKGRANAR